MQNVYLNWQLGNSFGWGILGMNLFFQWANDPEIRPYMGGPISERDVPMVDALRLRRAMPAIVHSNQSLAARRPGPDGRISIKGTVIDGLGNKFGGSSIVFGERNVARCIFEDTDTSGIERKLEKYSALLTASNWNAAILRAATRQDVKVIPEGVDVSIFCPGPKSGVLDPGKFYIFTGGKIEFRKGQDLTLLAFQQFSSRHPDAVLVTAWHSPWPKISAGFCGRLPRPLEVAGDGRLDIMRWVHQNGVDTAKVIDLGAMPNPMMPFILREMDVCLQPSRAEACTNLPVKEAMACGLPVIAGVNTGMLDLLTDQNCLPLRRQAPVPARDGWLMEGWGEADVEEIVAQLEFAYAHRDEARAIGAAARQWLIDHDRTWQAHAAALKSWLLGREVATNELQMASQVA